MISHNPAQNRFTTYINRSAVYNEMGIVLAGGPIEVDRCFALTYHRTTTEWKTSVHAADSTPCKPGSILVTAANGTQSRLRQTAGKNLTDTDIAREFNLTNKVWHTGFALGATHKQNGAVAITGLLYSRTPNTAVVSHGSATASTCRCSAATRRYRTVPAPLALSQTANVRRADSDFEVRVALGESARPRWPSSSGTGYRLRESK
ncbi:hypothetical protein ACH4GP_33965 [Streptomyces celluloflavus]|uniref:Uncharacterized protein n=1 Tax=Streptomyces celluloflavus TaxID=58344 RepID=A0ABW7RML9_9ACTN